MVHGSFVEEMIDARLEEKDVMDTGLEEGESLVVESNPLARESLQSELWLKLSVIFLRSELEWFH